MQAMQPAAIDLAAIKPLRTEAIDWTEAQPTLEDVFIHLMGRARDNALDG